MAKDKGTLHSRGKSTIEKTDNVSEKNRFETPEEVFEKVSEARIVYEKTRNQHVRRSGIYAHIQGMFDGNPPYSKSKMYRAGKEDLSNLSMRDGEAILEANALIFWSLINEVEFLANIVTTIGQLKPDKNLEMRPQTDYVASETQYSSNEAPYYSRVISEEFDKTVRAWPEFENNMAQKQVDMLKFGNSWSFFPDEDDWRWQAVDVWKFLVPDRTRNNIGSVTMAFAETIMNPQELWEICESGSKEWDCGLLKEFLWQKSSFYGDEGYSDMCAEEFQRQIRNGDIYCEDAYNEDIALIHALGQEYNGKVSHYIFDREGHNAYLHGDEDTSSEIDLTHDGFLFKVVGQYDQMSHAITMFNLTPGARYIHEVKGLGHKIFNIVETLTHIDNSLINAQKRSSTVLIRTKAGRNKEMKKVKFTYDGFVDIGEAEFEQNLMGTNLNPSLEVSKYFRAKLFNNNNMTGFDTSPENQRTLGEIRIQATKEARVQKNLIAIYYNHLDRLFEEMFRKMLNNQDDEAVADFIKRCIDRGVPEQVFEMKDAGLGTNGLPMHFEINASRASGSGSQMADQIEMEQMMKALPTLGERGRREVQKDWIASVRGYRYIPRYMPDEDQNQQPTAEDIFANMENNQLEEGKMLDVSPDQSAAIHLPRHIKRAMDIMKLYKEKQYDLQDANTAMSALGPHITKHMQFLEMDPTRKEKYSQHRDEWNIIANFADEVKHNAMKQREAQMKEMQKQQEQMAAQLGAQEDPKIRLEYEKMKVDLYKFEQQQITDKQRDSAKFQIEREKILDGKDARHAEAIRDLGDRMESQIENANKPK